MKSKIKFIIIAAVILIILGGVTAALLLTSPDDAEDTADEETVVESSLIYDKDPADISILSITNEYGSYKINRVSSGEYSMWTIVDYILAPISDTFINTALNGAGSLTARKTVMENAEDMSIYGLTEPSAEYTVTFDDSAKSEYTVKIGDKVPGSSVYSYMSIGDENTVYTVKDSDVAFAKADGRDCVNKVVFTQQTAEDENDTTDYSLVNKLTISRKDLDYDIVINYDTRLDDENIMVSNSSNYRMSEPVVLDINPDTGSDVMSGMFGLTASDFAVIRPEEDDLAQYGLDDPQLVVTADTNSGEFTLKIGNKAENGGYYGMACDIDMVYIFDESTLPWLTVMPLDITTTMITSHYIYGIDSISIKTDDVDVKFDIKGSGADDFGVESDGKEMDADAFKTLYQFILRAPSEQLYFDEVSGTPDATIEIRAEDGDDSIEFYNIGDRRTVIVLNGKPSFSCATAYVERLAQNVQKYLNGEELITSW